MVALGVLISPARAASAAPLNCVRIFFHSTRLCRIFIGLDCGHDSSYCINAGVQRRHAVVARDSSASADLGLPSRVGRGVMERFRCGMGFSGDAAGEGLAMGKGLLSAYWWALLFAWVWTWAKHLAWSLVWRLH